MDPEVAWMVTLDLTNEQVAGLVEQLPPAQRQEVLLRLASKAASGREQRMRLIEDRLRHVSAERGRDWDRMTDQERQDFVDDLFHEDRG